MVEVEYQLFLLIGRIGVFMNTGPFGCCQLHFDLIVGQQHFVVAWTGYFGVVAESGTIAAVRIISRTRVDLQFSGEGHQQNITEVGMPRSAEVGMAEADDGTVFMLVAGTVFIHARLIDTVDVMRNGIGIRTYLYDTKRSAGAGKCMSHPVCSDDRIYQIGLLCHNRHAHVGKGDDQ